MRSCRHRRVGHQKRVHARLGARFARANALKVRELAASDVGRPKSNRREVECQQLETTVGHGAVVPGDATPPSANQRAVHGIHDLRRVLGSQTPLRRHAQQ